MTKGADRLVIFTRFPVPGRAKTRLIPALGAVGAADLQRKMTEYTLAVAFEFAERYECEIEVRYTGGTAASMKEWLGIDCRYVEQGEGDLGEKLIRAFADSFDDGSKKVVIMGSDCPFLTAEIMGETFNFLSDNDLVLGPATDGGYYLVGLKSPMADLFKGIAWGSDKVRKETINIAEKKRMSVELLRELDDVDRPEDLESLKECFEIEGDRYERI